MKINILRNVFKPGMSEEKIAKYTSKLEDNLTDVKNNVKQVDKKTRAISEIVKDLINQEPEKHKDIKKQTLEAKISKTKKEIRDVGKKILENIKKSKDNAISKIQYLQDTSGSIAARNSSSESKTGTSDNENRTETGDEINESASQNTIEIAQEIQDEEATGDDASINLLKEDISAIDSVLDNKNSTHEEISDLAESMAGPNTKFQNANARSLKKLKSLKNKLETATRELEKNNSEESDQNSITDGKKDLMAKIAELKSKKIGYKKELKSVKSLEKQAEYLSDTIKSKEGRRSKKVDQISKPVFKSSKQDLTKNIDPITMVVVKSIDNSYKFASTVQKISAFEKYQKDLKQTSHKLKQDLTDVKNELKQAEKNLGIKPSFISRLLSGKLNPFKSSQKAAQTTGSTPSVDTSSTTSAEGVPSNSGEN